MKRLICTRSDKNTADIAAITLPFLEAYAKRCGADFRLLGAECFTPSMPGGWCYRILAVRDLLKKYDRVLHIDVDTLVKPDCPDLFAFVPQDKIGSIREDVGSRQKHRRAVMADLQAKMGDVGWTSFYPNTGCVLFSRCHAPLFEIPPQGLWAGWGLDDAWLAWNAKRLGMSFYELPPTMNWMSVFSEKWAGSQSRLKAYIVHYAGNANFPDKGNRSRLQLIRDDAAKLGEAKPARRIVLVGAFGFRATEVPMAQALARLGCEAVGVPYRDIIRKHGLPALHSVLRQLSSGADAMVIFKGAGMGLPMLDPHAIAGLKCPTVYWLPDNVDIAGAGLLALGKACTAFVSPCLRSCEAARDAGIDRVNQIFMTHDPRAFHPWPDTEQTRDVTFVGVVDEERKALIDHLRADGINVQTPEAWGEDASRTMAESKITLNFTRGELLSNRVFFALASGAFLASNGCKDLRAIFEPGKHYAEWDGYGQLRDTVRYYLDRPDERARIAEAGRLAVQPWSIGGQMAKLLRVIEGEPIRDGAFSG